MGGKTWTLIGLEHVVCPPILGREPQVWIQAPVPTGARILNESELRLTKTRAGAGDVPCSVHSAYPWCICVALPVKSFVCVAQIVGVPQRNWQWLRHARRRVLV